MCRPNWQDRRQDRGQDRRVERPRQRGRGRDRGRGRGRGRQQPHGGDQRSGKGEAGVRGESWEDENETGTREWAERAAQESSASVPTSRLWDVSENTDGQLKDKESTSQREVEIDSSPQQKAEDGITQKSSKVTGGSNSQSESRTYQSKVFSLTQESKLLVRPSAGEGGRRGRGRGRGWREKLGAPKVGSITVIEPLEKRLPPEQTEDVKEEQSNRLGMGLPRRGQPVSSNAAQGETPTVSDVEKGATVGEDGIQTSPVQVTKPKRYSSRRQKQGTTGEGLMEPLQQGTQILPLLITTSMHALFDIYMYM